MRSSRRGPEPTSLAELFLWEGLWYSSFLWLRGAEPSAEEVLLSGQAVSELRDELASLRKSLGEEDWPGARASSIARVEKQIKLAQGHKDLESLAEPDVWNALVEARTADDVRRACRKSKRWLNPEWAGRVYVQRLSEKAEQFVRAKNDPYYPRSARRSSDMKRVTFFARVMAGVTLGISPSTAVDKLRKVKHGEGCVCVHCDRELADRMLKFQFQELERERKSRR